MCRHCSISAISAIVVTARSLAVERRHFHVVRRNRGDPSRSSMDGWPFRLLRLIVTAMLVLAPAVGSVSAARAPVPAVDSRVEIEDEAAVDAATLVQPAL